MLLFVLVQHVLLPNSRRELAQSCPTLHDPMNCSLPGSSIHVTFQARVLEWVDRLFSVKYFLLKQSLLQQHDSKASILQCSAFFMVQLSDFLDNMYSFYFQISSTLCLAMASHSSTLAWKIPWTEEPGRLQSMRSQGVGYN